MELANFPPLALAEINNLIAYLGPALALVTYDDGNVEAGDGCSDLCLAETCGNGAQDAGETCDDANGGGGDGCKNCQVEDGYVCDGWPSVCTCGPDFQDNDDNGSCLLTCAAREFDVPFWTDVAATIEFGEPAMEEMSEDAEASPATEG